MEIVTKLQIEVLIIIVEDLALGDGHLWEDLLADGGVVPVGRVVGAQVGQLGGGAADYCVDDWHFIL